MVRSFMPYLMQRHYYPQHTNLNEHDNQQRIKFSEFNTKFIVYKNKFLHMGNRYI